MKRSHQVGSQSDSSCPEKRANSLRAFNTNIFRNSIQWHMWHALLGRLVLNGLHQSCVIRCPCFSASGVLAEACPFGTTPRPPYSQASLKLMFISTVSSNCNFSSKFCNQFFFKLLMLTLMLLPGWKYKCPRSKHSEDV